MLRWENTDQEQWRNYCAALETAGFVRTAENQIGEHRFATYKRDSDKLTVSYLSGIGEIRVIGEENRPFDFMTEKEGEEQAVTLTQFSTHTSHSRKTRGRASGMGYIFRLRDGRLFVIDGGFHLAPEFGNDYETLVPLLWELSGGKKPRIAAWMITHPHKDHYGVVRQWKEEDGEIEAYLTNLTPDEAAVNLNADLVVSVPHFEEKNRTIHTGDVLRFGGLEMEFFYTSEDMFVENGKGLLGDGNNISPIFRVTVGGQRIIFTGDARPSAQKRALRVAGDEIAGDICQISHHGRTEGAQNVFYEAVSPRVALWPGCHTQIDFDTDTVEGCNAWIFGETSTVIDHIVANDGTKTLTLPYTPQNRPYQKGEKTW